MQTARSIEVRDNFKQFCDTAHSGEPIRVVRKGNKDVVIIAVEMYEKFMELQRAAEIEAAVKRAEEDIKAGRVYTSEQMREQMRMRRNVQDHLFK